MVTVEVSSWAMAIVRKGTNVTSFILAAVGCFELLLAVAEVDE